jgi:serine phosphatase RsbU (regulator of sigma subunit)
MDGFSPLLADPVPVPERIPGILPSHPRLQFGRFYRSDRPAARDYHDVLNLGGNRFAIVMADISGPGASEATVIIPALVREHAGRHADAGSLIYHLNDYFHDSREDGVSATGLCAVVDTRRRTLRISSAGHPAPLLTRAGGVSPLQVHAGRPLGHDDLILSVEHTLCEGDQLLFHTERTLLTVGIS